MIIDGNVTYFIILIALIVVLFLIRFLVMKYAKGEVTKIMLGVEKKLSTWAIEKAAGGNEKRLAAERVIVEKFYPLLPKWAKLFITEEWIIKQIEILYLEMLDYLDDGKLNDSV